MLKLVRKLFLRILQRKVTTAMGLLRSQSKEPNQSDRCTFITRYENDHTEDEKGRELKTMCRGWRQEDEDKLKEMLENGQNDGNNGKK